MAEINSRPLWSLSADVTHERGDRLKAAVIHKWQPVDLIAHHHFHHRLGFSTQIGSSHLSSPPPTSLEEHPSTLLS